MNSNSDELKRVGDVYRYDLSTNIILGIKSVPGGLEIEKLMYGGFIETICVMTMNSWFLCYSNGHAELLAR